MSAKSKSERIQQGYQLEKKGYQPAETPASPKPPQGGSGTVPASSQKPTGQESGGKK